MVLGALPVIVGGRRRVTLSDDGKHDNKDIGTILKVNVNIINYLSWLSFDMFGRRKYIFAPKKVWVRPCLSLSCLGTRRQVSKWLFLVQDSNTIQ